VPCWSAHLARVFADHPPNDNAQDANSKRSRGRRCPWPPPSAWKPIAATRRSRRKRQGINVLANWPSPGPSDRPNTHTSERPAASDKRLSEW